MADTQPLDQTATPGSRPPSALKPNEVLAGRYELIRFIANGGMGEVWEANDRALNERVALKTIRADALNEQMLERFRREVKLARKVSHRNVCRVFEFGEHKAEDGQTVTFLTMELLVGTPLDALLRERGKLPPSEALGLLEQMAAALDAAHAEGIVHRDFKTPNVFVVPTTTGQRVVVTDFGIARALSDDARLTVDPSQMIGTPAYMAPEQVEGSTVGPAADLYALGVVAFELVSGQLPFAGPSAMAMALTRLREPARRLADVEPGLDPRWDAAVAKALARQPEQRFTSASAFVAALRGSARVTPADPIRALAVPPVSNRRTRVTFVFAGLVALAAIALFLRWVSQPPAAAITRGGVLHVAVTLPGGAIAPHAPHFTTSGLAAVHLYEPLATPGLLTTSVRGDDVLLRLAAPRMFHPHPCWPGGRSRPVTAEDIAFSFRAGGGSTGWTNMPAPAVEGDTVVLPGMAHREAQLAIWLEELELRPVIDPGCPTEAQNVPSGTGPFRFEQAEGPDHIVLARDDSNRAPGDQGPPFLDGVEIISAPSVLAVIPQLRSGALDIVEVPKSEWGDLFVDPHDRQTRLRPPYDTLPVKVATVKSHGANVMYLGISDNEHSPLHDRRIRRAIAVGIDRAPIAKLRHGNPFGRLIPANIAGAAPVLTEALEYRPDESRALIAEARAVITRPLVLGCFRQQREIGEEIARQLESEGLKVTVTEVAAAADLDLTSIDFFITIEMIKSDPLEFLMVACEPALAPKSEATLNRLLGMPYTARVREYPELERDMLIELAAIPLVFSDPTGPAGFYLQRPEVHGFADEDTHFVLEKFRLFRAVHLEPAGR